MSVVWLLTLLLYGLLAGLDAIPPFAWLLLVPMVIQDHYDSTHKGRRR